MFVTTETYGAQWYFALCIGSVNTAETRQHNAGKLFFSTVPNVLKVTYACAMHAGCIAV